MSASVLKTTVNTKSPEFEKNTRRMIDLLTQIKNEEEQICQGGGAKAIDAQHKKGRLTARERITEADRPRHASLRTGNLRRVRNVRGMGRRAIRRNRHRARKSVRPHAYDHRE